MATEKVEIFKVDTGQAVRSIADLKDNIKLLKEALDEQTIGTEEYQDVLNELKVNQNALKDAMYATSASMEDIAASAKGINVVFDENNQLINQENQSYNALVHTLAELKQEWRATTDEQRRGELGEQINQVNNELKRLDASVGNFQRNVGNYKSHWDGMAQAFKSTAGAAGGMIAPIMGVKNGLTAMSATPAVAVMGLLANVLNQVITSLKSSESATNNLNASMSGFHAIAEAVNNILVGLGREIADMVAWVSNLTAEIFHLKAATDQQNNAAQLSAELAGDYRTLTIKNAATEKYVAEQRAIASDKENKSLEQRMAAQKEAANAEAYMHQRNLEYAQKNLKYIQERNALGKSTKEQLDEEARAEAELYKVQAAAAASQRANNLAMQRLQKENNKTTAKTASELEKTIDAIRKKSVSAMRDVKLSASELDDFILETADGVDATFAAMNKEAAAYAAARLNIMQNEAETQLKWNEILVDDEGEKARKAYEIQQQLNLDKLDLLRQFAEEALMNGDAENLIAYQQQIADTELEIELATAAEKKRIRDKDSEDKKKRLQEDVSNLQAVAGATASILGTIADAYENDEKNAEKNAKKVKALRISEALINTISGAVGAFTQASATIPPPAGQIIGALTAAAVTASGMAQIAQIRKTQIGSGASSASAPLSVSAPALSSMPQNVRNVTSQSEEERLNRMASDQRVVLVQSDLEVASEQTRVQIAESTF